MATDWRSAYFDQAKSDYALFQKIARQDDIPLCQKLHYLQMMTEKMSKGFLTPPGSGQYKNTHKVFTDFVQAAEKNTALRQVCNIAGNAAFNAYIKALSPTAKLIEDLSPEGLPHPNPEYPWEIKGIIYTPVEHDFPAMKLSNNKMKKMIDFLEGCFKLIERES